MTVVVQLALGIAYPVVIFLALTKLEPRWVALIVLGMLGVRVAWSRPDVAKAAARAVWLPIASVAAVVAAAAIWNDPLGLLLTPVLVNAALLASFGLSLRTEEPIVERFARLQVGTLSDAERDYCRRVTWVWCGFFVVNGGVALGLALAGELELWALFTGLVSYALIGLLFAGEYVYRHWRFRRYVGGFADPLLKRLFPPEGPPRDLLHDPPREPPCA